MFFWTVYVCVQILDQVKYVSVWINASLKDDDDIQRQVISLTHTAQQTNSEARLISILLH